MYFNNLQVQMIPATQQQGQYFNPQFQAANNVLDYSFNILNPVSIDESHQIIQKFGPNATSLPAEGKNLLLSDFTAVLSYDPAAVQRWNTTGKSFLGRIRIAFSAFCFVVVVGTMALGMVDPEILSSFSPFLIVLCVVFVVGICIYGWRMTSVSARIQIQWQSDILTALKEKMNGWKARYPALTFTIIYPRIEKKLVTTGHGDNRRIRERIVAMWCHIRVTVGPCPTGEKETVFATTYDVNAPQQQQPIMVPVQQQMMMQVQQQQQPLMMPVQQQQPMVNGQQATTAIINGQQVMIIPMQQQMQIVPQSSGGEDPPPYTVQ